MIKLLLFSTLYPNAEQPSFGIFVEQRLRHLLARHPLDVKVVAPVPWSPFKARRFGRYASFARVPDCEQRHGVEIFHPRFLVLPKIGMNLAPMLLTRAMAGFLTALRRNWRFDLIDAHYFYPDGVAAVRLGKLLRVPVVVTARGTDLNLIAGYATPRRLIAWAAEHSAANVAVSRALKEVLIELGIPDQRTTVLRNGVDLELFRPVDRAEIRARLGLSGPVVLSVGHLIERKGHHIAIEALAELPEASLVIAGEGPLKHRLRMKAEKLGVTGRVRFAGLVAQEALHEYYNAADCLVLASSREGMPNVVLESIGCGTPVVAMRVWGIPEVLADSCAGTLVEERTAAAFAAALRRLLANPPDRAAIRRYAERFSWESTSDGQLAIFQRVVGAA